jgi:hypothetical protein
VQKTQSPAEAIQEKLRTSIKAKRRMNLKRSIAIIFSFLTAAVVAGEAPAPPVCTPPGGSVRSPALVTITSPNPQVAIFYTLDGSDPSDPFGNVVPQARRYSAPLSINRSMVIRARVKAGAEWSERVTARFAADQDFSKLLFTEVMYHPTHETERHEFIELKNAGTVPLDVSGLELMSLRGRVVLLHRFAEGAVIAPGAFYLLVNHPDEFQARYPGVPYQGVNLRRLDNSFDALAIQSTNAAVASRMFYDSHGPWPVVPDNHGYFDPNDETVGFSLVRVSLDPELDPEDYRTWRASAAPGGSPGADDPEPGIPPIYLNEFLTRSATTPDAIELFNPNPHEVHLGGWWLSDERNMPFGYQIPIGTVIQALGFIELDETQFGVGETNGFTFSAEGERAYLFSADTNGTLTGYSHGWQFAGSDRDVSFGRTVVSDGKEYLFAQVSLTLGAMNSGPRPPAVAISEIMYHPGEGDVQFIELRNTTAATVDLWDRQRPNLTWALEGFQFPPGVSLPPNGHALSVQGDPALFRLRHNVPAAVPIFQIPSGLNTSGGVVRLYHPSGISGDQPRYVLHDEVHYQNQMPWDPVADQGGYSLERMNLTGFGNEPDHWRASPTGSSPGRDNSPNLPPLVLAGGNRTNYAGRVSTMSGLIFDDRFPGTNLTSWWSQVSGPATVALTRKDAASATAVFMEPGRYILRLTASDGAFVTSDDTIVDVFTSPFEAWRAIHFTPAERENPLISGELADPDDDRLLNIEEYYFHTAPRMPDSRPWRVEFVDDRVQLSWTRFRDAVDVVVSAELADRIEGPWFGGPGLFEWTETVRPSEPLADVRVTEFFPANPASGFIRLQIGVK